MHRERKQLDGAPYPSSFLPTGHKDAEAVALEGTEEPLHRHCHLHRAFPQPWGKQGCPAWMAAPGSGFSRWEQGTGQRVVGSGRNVSKWADMGFKWCLDAKVTLLSEEACGIICSLAELTSAMLHWQHRQGEFTWGNPSVPGWGRLNCCQQL